MKVFVVLQLRPDVVPTVITVLLTLAEAEDMSSTLPNSIVQEMTLR